jgi:peptidoglycan/xylan/chitin deacetylase (PgdA/CDA1 family)
VNGRTLPLARVVLYVATIGAIGLVARGLVEGPLPIATAVGAFVGYLLLLGAGIAFLPLGMFVDVVWRGHRGARGVALTFDDGPSPEHTPKVLDLLDEAGVKATFFVIGRKAEAHPELVREIAARGHGLGVHGHTHDRFLSLRSPKRVAEDLQLALDAVERATGERPLLYRPPVGLTSPRIARGIERFEVLVVGWSLRALDGWTGAKADRVAARVVRQLRAGDVVLLHDAAERDDRAPAGVAALPRILRAMRDKDLPGVRLDAWLCESGEISDRRGRGRRGRRTARAAARPRVAAR